MSLLLLLVVVVVVVVVGVTSSTLQSIVVVISIRGVIRAEVRVSQVIYKTIITRVSSKANRPAIISSSRSR